MSIGNAVILGLLQGLTDFLPVSSSAHLSILSNLFGMTTAADGHAVFDVLLHLGTLLALVIVYWEDIVAMLFEALGFINIGPLAGERRARYPAARLFFMILLATLPMFLILPIKNMLDGLFYNKYFIGAALVLTGCMLYVADKMTEGRKTVGGMSIWDALIIGLCQCVAVIPGFSRLAATIPAGIATGLKRDFAVKFAFLMGIPTMLGAIILRIAEAAREGFDWTLMPAYLIGMAAAMISGIAAISFLKRLANRGGFGGFAYYCWVVGTLTVILTMIF